MYGQGRLDPDVHDLDADDPVVRAAAGMLCCGFRPDDRAHLDDLLRLGLGGVVLFSRNVTGGPDDVADLVRGLKTGNDAYVAIDQEGGRVRRLRDGFAPVPSMREVPGADLARDVGRLIGIELRACGIDLDFAPVVDVDSNPANPVIGDRSFGPDASHVGRLGAAMIEGLQEHVAACAKHFPGHGDTLLDSHTDLPRLDHDLGRLRRLELPPFADAIAGGVGGVRGVAAVMTAHVIFSPLDADYPATLSPPVMRILREELGFDGVLFSDDLEMKAVADRYGPRELVRRGLTAGLDVFLVCHTPRLQRQILWEIVSAVRDGIVPASRINQSMTRIETMKQRFRHPPAARAPSGVFAGAAYRRLYDGVFSRLASAPDATDPTVFLPA